MFKEARLLTRWFVCLLIMLPIPALGQYFSVGNDPVSLKWYQMKHPHFRLLYPEQGRAQARDMFRFLDQNLDAIGSSLDHTPRRFPLILHSMSSVSNGYTIWAPRRIELFPRNPVVGGAETYADHLLIHEVRHMVQMDKLHTGLTKGASWLLGEQAVAAVIGLHVPGWLSEGDAVLTETLLSQSGRGRQAWFHEDLRSLWLHGEPWSFDKAMFGSYRDYVPNHYVMGYHLVSMARLLGGWDIWERALTEMGRKPYRIALLSRFLNRELGYTKSGLYQKTYDWTRSYWMNEPMEKRNEPVLTVVHDTTGYVNYLKPVSVSSDRWIVLKTSMARIPEFVLLHAGGREEHLAYPGYIDHASFDYANNLLVWAEENPDIRWENRSYSNLYAYNLASRQKWQLTRKSRYHAPALSRDGARVAVVEFQASGLTRLVVLQTADARVLHEIDMPAGEIVQMPAWDNNGRIWFFLTGREGKKLASVSPENGQIQILSTIGFKEAFNPVPGDTHVFFVAPYGSSNAVFAISQSSKKTFLVSTDHGGIHYLSQTAGELHASVYRLNGYKPVSVPIDGTWEAKELQDLNDPYLPLLSRSKEEQPVVLQPEEAEPEEKRYRKFLHAWRFHSWAPVSLNTHTYQVRPGIMLLSQNDLGTLSARLGFEYDWQFRRHEEFLSLSIPGWPVKTDLEWRTYADHLSFSAHDGDTARAEAPYRSYQTTLRLNLPLDFSSGRWTRWFIIGGLAQYLHYQTLDPDQADSRQYAVAGLGAKWASLSRKAYRDLFSPLGLIIGITTTHQLAFFEGDGKTNVGGDIQAYLPGFIRNHSTRLYAGGYLRKGWVLPDQQVFSLPRGMYTGFETYNLSAKIDYAFPFWYPDRSLGSVLYVRRLKANIFADAASSLVDKDWFFWSAGLDLTADFNLFRMGVDLDAGARFIYRASDQKPAVELLFDFAIN